MTDLPGPASADPTPAGPAPAGTDLPSTGSAGPTPADPTSADARQPLTYAQAGVDVSAADAAVAALTPIARSTYRPEVLGDIGAFASVTAVPAGYDEPVLVTANDGAGTKPMIAAALRRFDTIGIDVVAMCVDDIATLGAEPLLFQDQITMGSVDATIVEQLVTGMAAGCRLAHCALTGGEIAEHPDEMAPDALDVCGFAVGVAERSQLPQPLTPAAAQSAARTQSAAHAQPANSDSPLALLIGLASPGIRCNGLSLARRALLASQVPADQIKRLNEPAWPGADQSLGDELLLPSVIYAPAVREMFQTCQALAAAHITGGGLAGNLARVLSPQVDAVIRRGTWPVPRIFDVIAQAGPVSPTEMAAVFNLGIGMLVAVPAGPAAAQASPGQTNPAAAQAIAVAQNYGHDAWVVGEVVAGTGQVHLVDAQ